MRELNHGLPKIKHVVVIVQENRTLNDLFLNFPGATTSDQGLNSEGKEVTLTPISLTARYDLSHHHSSFLQDYDDGKMDGWDTEAVKCKLGECPPPGTGSYGYVPQDEVEPYWELASQYVLADQMYQTNQGPSFPAHQYIVSGTSTIADGSKDRVSDNPNDPAGPVGKKGGCDSFPTTTAPIINEKGQVHAGPFPCYDRSSIFTLLDAAGITWRYYQYTTGPGLWNAVDALQPIWMLPEFHTNVVTPPSQVITDVQNNNLAQVSFVTPTALASDHALRTDGSGPDWVASVVDAIGSSHYWESTAIIITWDDWGGWFDPGTPHIYDVYEQGFRVPLIVVSPFAKRGYVSHVPHEFGSILHFIEDVYKLPSLGTTDARDDDLLDSFVTQREPRRFSRIKVKHSLHFFRTQNDTQVPDDD